MRTLLRFLHWIKRLFSHPAEWQDAFGRTAQEVLAQYEGERPEREADWYRRYKQTSGGEVANLRYQRSEGGKATILRHNQSEKGKATIRRYAQSAKGRASRHRYYVRTGR